MDVVVGIGGGSLFVLMIETPHTLHTHSRSSLYLYKVFQHLRQCLVVIRMQLQPDICSQGPKSGDVLGVGVGVGVSVGI